MGARGAASALQQDMFQREQDYVASANALRSEAEQQVLHAQAQVESIIRDVEARMPSMAQSIRAEVQGQAEAWVSQRVSEHAASMESQAAAALERQRQMLFNQANAEVTSRDQRIAALEEQNARLLEALKAQPPSSQMAAMTRLARDTPVDDVSGLTTPRSAAKKPAPPGEGSHQPLGLPPSWVGFPPGLGVSPQRVDATFSQQRELA